MRPCVQEVKRSLEQRKFYGPPVNQFTVFISVNQRSVVIRKVIANIKIQYHDFWAVFYAFFLQKNELLVRAGIPDAAVHDPCIFCLWLKLFFQHFRKSFIKAYMRSLCKRVSKNGYCCAWKIIVIFMIQQSL